MCDIYEGGALTFAASAAASGDDGCFSQRSAFQVGWALDHNALEAKYDTHQAVSTSKLSSILGKAMKPFTSTQCCR
jgi:hypothetical protein